MKITNEQWLLYEKKYKNLMYKISQLTSGDLVTTNPEDGYQELVVAAINSIYGFHNKTGEDFETMWANPLFDKYTKTCLWNSKNNRGKKLSKRIPFRNKLTTLHDNIVDSGDATSNIDFGMFISEITESLGELETKALESITTSDTSLTSAGRVNISALSRELGVSSSKARKAITNIANIIGSEL